MADPKGTDPIEAKKLLYSAIGQAISAWSALETLLVRLAAILLGASREKTGVVFYSIQNFHLWLNIIDELFNLEKRIPRSRKRMGAD
jgi:hypothetical protein